MPKRKAKTAPEVLNKMINQRPGGKKNTWASLAAQLSTKAPKPIDAGYLHQIATGQRRASNNVLIALRLPLNPVEAMPCAKCGEVHLKKGCTKKRQPKPKTWRSLNDLNPKQVIALLRGRKEYNPK